MLYERLGNSSILQRNRDLLLFPMAGHNLRVALESRWITKDKGAQIIFSRSFIVLVVQQNFCFISKSMEHPAGCSMLFDISVYIKRVCSKMDTFYLLCIISNGTLNDTPLFIRSVRFGSMRCLKLSQLRCGISVQPASARARARGKAMYVTRFMSRMASPHRVPIIPVICACSSVGSP